MIYRWMLKHIAYSQTLTLNSHIHHKHQNIICKYGRAPPKALKLLMDVNKQWTVASCLHSSCKGHFQETFTHLISTYIIFKYSTSDFDLFCLFLAAPRERAMSQERGRIKTFQSNYFLYTFMFWQLKHTQHAHIYTHKNEGTAARTVGLFPPHRNWAKNKA